jgi:hypothetical protein
MPRAQVAENLLHQARIINNRDDAHGVLADGATSGSTCHARRIRVRAAGWAYGAGRFTPAPSNPPAPSPPTEGRTKNEECRMIFLRLPWLGPGGDCPALTNRPARPAHSLARKMRLGPHTRIPSLMGPGTSKQLLPSRQALGHEID